MSAPSRRRRLLAGKKPATRPDRDPADASPEGASDHRPADLLPSMAEAEPAPTDAVARRAPLPPVAANPGPLPDPLPPRLDAVVRRLREDLLVVGGEAAGLADEICARHRDRLREALGLTE